MDFDGADDLLDAGSGASLDNNHTLTYSAWIKPDTLGGANAGFVMAKDSGFKKRFLLNASNQFAMRVVRDTTSASAQGATDTITLGSWQYMVVTYNETDGIKIYKNGTEIAYTSNDIGTGATTDDATDNFVIGAFSAASQQFDGSIDEVRVSSINRSSDWRNTEYNNQNSPSTFYTLGSEISYGVLLPHAPSSITHIARKDNIVGY